MKSCLLFLFLYLFSNFSAAQTTDGFAPIGATWHFTERSAFEPNVRFIRIESLKDTIIKGKDARILERNIRWCNGRENIEWMHFRKDSLFYFDVEADKFKLLIDFSAEVGETWELELWGFLPIMHEVDVLNIHVDSISYLYLNSGDSLRIQHTSFTRANQPDWKSSNYDIIEKIGFTAGLLPFEEPLCDGNYIQNIRCYEDENIEKIKFAKEPCDTTYSPPRTRFLINGITKQWNVVFYETFSPNVSTVAYRTGRDTFINRRGRPYVQIERTSDSTLTNWQPTGILLREEAYTSRVYMYDASEEIDELLYDFDLSVGSTFSYFDGCTVMVTAVDSIKLENNELRKRLELEFEDYNFTYWIEGIGSTIQPFAPPIALCATDSGFPLSCYYENEERVFKSGGECFVVNTQEHSKLQQFSLFPSPTNSVLQFDLSEISIPNLEIQIFSALGQSIRSIQAQTTQIQQIEVSDLPSGVYFLILEKDGQLLWSEKFVKGMQ